MEKTRVSAFALYRTVLEKDHSSLKVAHKKKRPKENAQISKSSKKTKRKQTCTVVSDVEEKTAKPAPVAHPLVNRKGVEGPALDSLLVDLARIQSSRERANRLFDWLIHPVPAQSFFRELERTPKPVRSCTMAAALRARRRRLRTFRERKGVLQTYDNNELGTKREMWEKKPALIRRHNPEYYKGLFSTTEIDRILREDDVQFGVNLDVTSYTNGQRETHNPPGRALPFAVWDFYKRGCSLRFLNPQSFSSTVWNVLSILQERFGSMAGANVYLTPPGTQGFAPHYDDIEAFVIQLEGKKHWRVYNPRSEDEVLPVLSSPNFSQSEIGKPILEVVLEAGDLLYFPRGFVHQGDCLPDDHSLHITISSYQKNSWGDLLHKLVPAALEMAMEEDAEFRKGLPLDYLTYMGVQNSDKEDPRRAQFTEHLLGLMKKLTSYAPVDAAVDQKAKEFLHDCLPPVLTPEEKACSVQGAPSRCEGGQAREVKAHIKAQTKIRLIRDGIARLCSEGDAVFLYHTVDNSRVYHKEEPKCFEINPEHTDGVEFLIRSSPKFVSVGSLPCDTIEDKLSLAELLFEKGLVQTSEALLFS